MTEGESKASSSRADGLPDLDVLRRAREERGETLAQAARFTNIRLDYLRRLEDGDTGAFDSFPGHVYVRFFLREYAEHLGLEAGPLLRRLDREPSGPVLLPARPIKARRPRPMRWAATAAFVLIALLVGSALVASRPIDPPSAPISTSSPQRQGPADATRSATHPARVDSIDLRISVSAACWVRAVVDGRATLEETLLPGKTVHLRATREMTIRLGNARAATLTVNGRTMHPDGGGDVVDLSFDLRAGRLVVS